MYGVVLADIQNVLKSAQLVSACAQETPMGWQAGFDLTDRLTEVSPAAFQGSGEGLKLRWTRRRLGGDV